MYVCLKQSFCGSFFWWTIMILYTGYESILIKKVDIDRTSKLVSFTIKFFPSLFDYLRVMHYRWNDFFFYAPYKDDIIWSMMLFCWKLCHFRAIIVYFLQKILLIIFVNVFMTQTEIEMTLYLAWQWKGLEIFHNYIVLPNI